MEDRDQKPFLCALCFETFTELDELNVHQQIEHHMNQLNVASYSERVKEELNEDVRSHSVEHLDPEIGSPDDISVKMTETDQKPHLCNMCIQVFADLDSLVSHQEEEYFCPVDPLGSTSEIKNEEQSSSSDTKAYLEKKEDSDTSKAYVIPSGDFHIKSEGIFFQEADFIPSNYIKSEDSSNSLSFTCPQNYVSNGTELKIGGKHIVTNTSKSRSKHLLPGRNTRTEKKPFHCDLCEKTFIRKYSLTVHLRTHTGEKPFKCDQCDRGFTQKGDLNQHVRIHSGVKPFECEQCHKSFTKRYHLLRHLRVHSGEKPFKCDQCNKAYSGKHHLTHHLLTHSEEQPLSCDQCHKTFMSRIDLLRRLCIRPGEKTFQCKVFKRDVNLFRHLKSHAGKRPESSEKRKWPMSRRKSRSKTVNERKKLYHCFRCRRCFKLKLHLTCHKIRNKYGMCKCKRRNKNFGISPFLSNTQKSCKESTLHLASRFVEQQKSKYLKQCYPFDLTNCEPGRYTHEKPHQRDSLTEQLRASNFAKPFQCDQCDKAFTRKYNLTYHLRIHSGEKPFTCDQCDKTFTRKCYLTYHLRIHSGEKPFHCDRCNKGFTQRSDLSRHQRQHTGDKPYKCDRCNKAFTQSGDLTRHLRIHSREKPFKCNQCDKTFTQKPNLIYHLSTRTGEKPFSCNQCDKTFIMEHHLTYHLRTHSGEKPFKCDQCDKAFTRNSDLIRHLRTHSREKPFKCGQCNKAYKQKNELTLHLRTQRGKTLSV